MSNKLVKKQDKKRESLLVLNIWAVVMISIVVWIFYTVIQRSFDVEPYENVATSSNANYGYDDIAVGFLTMDGVGIASRPFMLEPEIKVTWVRDAPEEFIALPLIMYGKAEEEGKQLTVYYYELFPYEYGTTGAADAYFTCIEKGWQEGFEDLWTEVYNQLNDVEERKEINPVICQEILNYVYGKEEFGDLRDIVTDCLVLINDINLNGPSEEYNAYAQDYYNRFYSWLCNFSVDLLKS